MSFRFFVGLLLAAILMSANAEPIQLGSSYLVKTYFPYVEPVVTEAFSRIGQPIEIFDLPNERSNIMQSTGQIDGQIFRYVGYGNEVANVLRVDVNLGELNIVAVVHEDSELTELSQLQGKTMSYEVGIKLQKQAMENLNAVPAIVNSLEICAKMVEYQRVDFTVLTDKITDTFIQNGYKIKVLGEPLRVSGNYLWLDKKYADIVPDLERELRNLQAEGRF